MIKYALGFSLFFFAASCQATIYQCSIYEVEVAPLNAVKVGGKVAQYSHSMMDKNMNLIDSYQGEDEMVLMRETPRRRIAYRAVGDFGWKSCKVIEDAKH